jgi:hypothetical protein
MGISTSKPNVTEDIIKDEEITNLPEQIDDIATKYILTQNTIDLIRLGDKDYYNNMIILTSSILDKRLTKLELGFLNERIQHGVQEPIYAQDKHDMTSLIPKNDRIKHKFLHNISKYYMKIITIYSAVVATMDPQYFYEDEQGEHKTFYLKDFGDYKSIPQHVKPRISQITNPLNLCRKRLNILKNKLNIEGEQVTINPGEKLCSMNDSPKRLNEEIGIKEMDLLYFDIFDNNEKKWAKMSNKMKKKYNKDLTIFYQIFTGKKNKPKEIKSFHDIELLDFKTFDYCDKEHFVKDLIVSKNNQHIKKYLDKIYIIQEHTNTTKEKLLYILKKIFISEGEEYKINPELTLDKLIQLENDTRDIILHLYTTCEKYFVQALIIFEKIFEEQTHELNLERDNNMKNTFVIPTNIPSFGETDNDTTDNSLGATDSSLNDTLKPTISDSIQSTIMNTFGFNSSSPPETSPPETPSAETPSAETPPPETPPPETPSAETPSVVETPPPDSQVETPSVETPPPDSQVETPPVVETPSVETPPVVETPVETPPVVETQSVETPPVVERPPETQAETPSPETASSVETQQVEPPIESRSLPTPQISVS